MGAGRIAQAAHLKKPLRGFFAAGTDSGGRCCSNPPACVSLLFVQKKNARVFLHKRSLGGRGWIARAAHLKKPRRGFFAAGTYGGGRCCSNPPATIPLICFYKTETPAPGSDTGVLGGRGWIARAAHLKKPRRGFFAAGTHGGGRCCSNPPAAVPLICFYKTETPASGSDTGVLGGRGWIRTTEAEKQQIYSLSPLATREHAHILFTVRVGLPVYLTTAPWICQVFCRKLFCRNAGSLFPKEKHPNPQRIQVP